MPTELLALIGGTGLHFTGPGSALQELRPVAVATRFGVAHLFQGVLHERPVVVMHRHAQPERPNELTVPPHKVNYRAQMAALKSLGVTGIIASTAVGSLRADWPPGTLVLLDDFLDRTTCRPKTFFDERAVHVDVTLPYCQGLRAQIRSVAVDLGVALHDGGTYLCVDGPRFESAAEIRAFAQCGAEVVGMTGLPECVLAREAEISYAGISIVTNLAAGLGTAPLSHHEVMSEMALVLPKVAELLQECGRAYRDDRQLPARTATRGFVTPDFDPTEYLLGRA